MAPLSDSRLILLPRATPNVLDLITMKALHLPSSLPHFASSWLLLQLRTLNSTQLTSPLLSPMVTLMKRSTEGFHIGAPNQVCRLRKSLYGLKQSAQQWNKKLLELP